MISFKYLSLHNIYFFKLREPNLFDVNKVCVAENITIHIIDIKEINLKLKEFLDEHLVSICEGDSGSELQSVKELILDFLNTKDLNTRMGATAEFFLHLYLKNNKFKQECLFFNLEERSIKKGFDGYYSFQDEEYIMESKSGSINTTSISHLNKLKEAYEDLKNNVSGQSKKSKNNPWKNAYNHASHIDVGAKASIRKNIKSLSDSYDKSIFYNIKNFNIIPASTIYLNNTSDSKLSANLIDELKLLSEKIEFEKIHLICVTKSSLNMFNLYLSAKD